MPEVWLPYGSVEVVVDVRAENLAKVVERTALAASGEALKEKLRSISPQPDTLLVVPKATSVVIAALTLFLEQIEQATPPVEGLRVATTREFLARVRKACESRHVGVMPLSEPKVPAGTFEGLEVKVPRELAEAKSRILLSEVGFDPLYGFTGGPVSLLSLVDRNARSEAFRRGHPLLPQPGEGTEAAGFASGLSEIMGPIMAVQVLSAQGKVGDLFVGSVIQAHKEASTRLLETASSQLSEQARAAIVTPGGGGQDATLHSSLKAVWNTVGAMKEKGVVALVAECIDGLGSPALKLFASGRLKPEESVRRGEYVDGLEDLLYLKEIGDRFRLLLVSTLPHFFAESKLGLKAQRKAGDAVRYALDTLGARTKIHIVPWANETLLRAGPV